LIVKELLARKPAHDLAVSVRDPAKASALRDRGIDVRRADFSDPASLTAAFEGIAAVMLVSGDADVEIRKTQHRNAIAAAEHANVKHIVYTSYLDADTTSPFPFAAIHSDTEAVLRKARLAWTVLRAGSYAELVIGAAREAARTGVFATPAPEGRVGYVARADIARAAAAALCGLGHEGKTYELTGPQALSAHDLATIISRITRKAVTTQPITVAEYIQMLEGHGLPAFLAQALGGMQLGNF
jgi:NAD(P)H dehydrogenase (quinone)